jgi:hypothetical protein
LAFSQVLCWSMIPQLEGQYEHVSIFLAFARIAAFVLH